MRRFSSKKRISAFSPKNKAAYTVRNGEKVVIEAGDCFSGHIKNSSTLFESVPGSKINPATGPIEVLDMSAGNTLCVTIEKIKCGPRGVMVCSPELGNLASDVRRSRTRLIPIKGNMAQFSKDIWISLNPHVGVLGVSPAKGEFPTFYPGDYGGNMDTVDAGAGSKVYLPTFVDGAMFALGDLHAAMGDGEVCGTGIEVPGEVTVTLSRSEDLELKRPMIETSSEWITFAAAKTLDQAARIATNDMVRFISNRLGTDFEEAYMLASAAANLRISQVVDPLMAARMCISKRYL